MGQNFAPNILQTISIKLKIFQFQLVRQVDFFKFHLHFKKNNITTTQTQTSHSGGKGSHYTEQPFALNKRQAYDVQIACGDSIFTHFFSIYGTLRRNSWQYDPKGK